MTPAWSPVRSAGCRHSYRRGDAGEASGASGQQEWDGFPRGPALLSYLHQALSDAGGQVQG